jgi:hypothetical protein
MKRGHTQGLLASVLLSVVAGYAGCHCVSPSPARPTVCAEGKVTFAMQKVAGSADSFCIGAPGACSNQWLTIIGPDRPEGTIDTPCRPDCTSCQPVGCPALCPAPTPMQGQGVDRTWDGTWFASSTCGAATACSARSCAAPGRYIARMCAYRNLEPASIGNCSPASTPTCTDVEFDWPPATTGQTVQGFIGESPDSGADATDAAPTDAKDATEAGGDTGKCCPATWLMYGCTYPDGSPGLNCHNPALGCPSSSTCGGGCDFIVAGKCGG